MLRLSEPCDGDGEVAETAPEAQGEFVARADSVVPEVPAHSIDNSSRERRGARNSKRTSRAVGISDSLVCRCGETSCLDEKALASIATLRKTRGHGPEGELECIDFDMPTPVTRSHEEGHVPEGMLKSVDTDMPTHMKETSWLRSITSEDVSGRQR